jgi:GTP-binding protein Era
MKFGKILLIGRPNVGKSTFLNNLIGQKVAITSPKPQTTRFPIKAWLQEPRGILLFVDTPGIMGKTQDNLSKQINQITLRTLNEEVDMVIYMIDHTRKRDFEEARVLGIVRKLNKPKILVINKIDKQDKTFLPQYEFLTDEFPLVYKISALNNTHTKPLLDKMFELAPEKNPKEIENLTSELHHIPYPLINIDSKIFIAELIREKVFIMMGEEIPYTTTVLVDDIKERKNGLLYIKARILTTNDRYKKMLIGKEGWKIKEIGAYARKEIALATNKKIYLDLKIETDPHWQEVFYG